MSPSATADFQRISTPENRNALDCTNSYRREGLNFNSPKISGSGWKVTVVPRRLGAAPIFSNLPSGNPRENRCWYRMRLRATSTTMLSDSAFTTEEPTPFSPPEVA